jgi:23S rRNA pseudouridine2605 synthase
MMSMKPKQKSHRIGLARALSKLGYCSRTQAAELIRTGHVHLNERLHRDPDAPVHLDHDCITVDGNPIEARTKVYLVMNKPRGLVTTASDEKGRETVYALLRAAMQCQPNHKSSQPDPSERAAQRQDAATYVFPEDHSSTTESEEQLPWVAPVGRLDKASEGLLLVTNDSEWAARIAAPKTHLDKTYHVQIATVVAEAWTQSLIRGVRDEDGEMLRAKQARVLRSGQKNCWLEIILDEGKNRQIRRMLAARSVEVLRLVRVAIGPLQLGNLPKGTFRPLTRDEKRSLDGAMLANEARRNATSASREGDRGETG